MRLSIGGVVLIITIKPTDTNHDEYSDDQNGGDTDVEKQFDISNTSSSIQQNDHDHPIMVAIIQTPSFSSLSTSTTSNHQYGSKNDDDERTDTTTKTTTEGRRRMKYIITNIQSIP